MKLTRISAGNYTINYDNHTFKVWQYNDGSYKGYWMIEVDNGSYSDPVPTLKQAKIHIENWFKP